MENKEPSTVHHLYWDHLNIRMVSYQYRHSHYEYKTFSRPPYLYNVQPEVRTGTKWSAAKAVQEAEASLQIKEVIGATQTGRAGLGSTPHRWFSREDSKGRRDMVITELKMI